MAKMQFDPEDAALTVLAFIGASAMAGIATWTLFDVSLGDSAFQLAGNDVTLATLLTLVAVVGTIVTNDNTELSEVTDDLQNLDEYYMYVTVASLALLVGWVFFPEVSSFVTSQDLWGVLYIGVTVTSQFVLGWML